MAAEYSGEALTCVPDAIGHLRDAIDLVSELQSSLRYRGDGRVVDNQAMSQAIEHLDRVADSLWQARWELHDYEAAT